jgi:hypothetical protein
MTDAQILRLYQACRRISLYDTVKQLRKNKDLDYPECLEMAYENVIIEAKNAIKGLTPKSFKNLKNG